MTEGSVALVDSNILIYSIDSSDREKHLTAKKLLSACWSGKIQYAVSLQNLSEFFVNATVKVAKPITHEKGAKIVERILEYEGFLKLTPTQQTLKKALHLSIQKKESYWDALIAATMLENSITHIYTENTQDFAFPSITAINPFEKQRQKSVKK